MARRRTFVRSSSIIVSMAALAAAHAQSDPPNATPGDQLEDVVVTAQRRAEKLQDVPISMSAVTGATLENFGDKAFTDYAMTIPNLAVTSGAGAGGNGNAFGVSSTRAIAIRGVFGNNTTGFYLNDTPVPMSLDPRVVDIDRVEVLRGPQGTLFGQGSMGGTVRLVTRDPALDNVYGKVDAEGNYVEHGGGGYSAQGTLNVPVIAGNVGLRLSAYSAFDPGLFTRTWGGPLDPRSPIIDYPPGGAPVGHKDHVGAEQGEGFSAALKIAPEAIPGLSITPLFMFQHTNTNGYPLADYTPDNFTQTRPLNVPEAVEDKWSFGALTVKHEASFGRLILSGTYFYRRAYDLEDTSDANAIVFWGLPYYVPAPLPNVLNTRTWTGEVRFESTFKGPLQFVVGFFDSTSERHFRENYLAPGLDAASGGTIGTDLEYTQNTPNADRERAEFIDVTYKPIRQIEISAGVRRAYLAHEAAYTADGPLNGGSSGPPDTYSNASEYDTAPRYTAKYQYAANQMVYASAAKGFRIGGTNSVLPPICDADLAALGLKNGAAFKSDSLWSYEIGAKNTFADDRVRTRLAAYRINWKGIQQSVYLSCTFNVVANSGEAESKGAEAESDLALIDHLTLNLSLGYEDARITQATAASRTVVGQTLTGVPKWSGSATAQYTIPLDVRTAFLRAQWEYVGDRTSFNNVSPQDGGRDLGSYGLLNLRAGFNQGPWELTLSARNVFNRLGVIGDLIPEGAELAGRPKLFVTRPRTIGLELKREF
jgi:outer membrane receptor protein involved in Fe transport